MLTPEGDSFDDYTQIVRRRVYRWNPGDIAPAAWLEKHFDISHFEDKAGRLDVYDRRGVWSQLIAETMGLAEPV